MTIPYYKIANIKSRIAYHRDRANENVEQAVFYDSKQIETAKADAFEQAIAIIEEEVTKND